MQDLYSTRTKSDQKFQSTRQSTLSVAPKELESARPVHAERQTILLQENASNYTESSGISSILSPRDRSSENSVDICNKKLGKSDGSHSPRRQILERNSLHVMTN